MLCLRSCDGKFLTFDYFPCILERLFFVSLLSTVCVGRVVNRIRTTQWAIAGSLGLNPKDGPETCHHKHDPPRLPHFSIPRGVILNGNLEDIACMAVFRQASFEPGPPGPELSVHPTCPPRGSERL